MTHAGEIVSVVDDDPGVRCAVDRLLRSIGVQTQLFASARDFLAVPATWPPPAASFPLSSLAAIRMSRRVPARSRRAPPVFLPNPFPKGTCPKGSFLGVGFLPR